MKGNISEPFHGKVVLNCRLKKPERGWQRLDMANAIKDNMWQQQKVSC